MKKIGLLITWLQEKEWKYMGAILECQYIQIFFPHSCSFFWGVLNIFNKVVAKYNVRQKNHLDDSDPKSYKTGCKEQPHDSHFLIEKWEWFGQVQERMVVRLRIGSLYRYWFFNIFSSFWGIDQRNSESASEKVIDSREKVIITNFVSRSLEECFSSIDSYRLALISIPSKKWINWMKPKETYF